MFKQDTAWILTTLRLNWRNAMADKVAFWSMVWLMAMQNLIYFSLWAIIFTQISALKGWRLPDVAFLCGIGEIGYGLAFAFGGGIYQISTAIRDGILDVYLTRPREILLSLAFHRLRADAIGDILSGLFLIIWFVPLKWWQLPLLLVLSLLTGAVYAAFRLMAHSLAFWGTGHDTGENSFMAFLIAATNPPNGFGAWGKLLLLTLFPAGYISLLPVEIIRKFDIKILIFEIAGSIVVAGFSIWFFYRGLRRYTAGEQFF